MKIVAIKFLQRISSFGFLAKDFEGDEKKFFAIKNNLGVGRFIYLLQNLKNMIFSCVIAYRKS